MTKTDAAKILAFVLKADKFFPDVGISVDALSLISGLFKRDFSFYWVLHPTLLGFFVVAVLR
jgi:hypothetical protein